MMPVFIKLLLGLGLQSSRTLRATSSLFTLYIWDFPLFRDNLSMELFPAASDSKEQRPGAIIRDICGYP
jgi:hypothetical protein